MQNAFMTIIALLGAGYALLHKEGKVAAGLAVIAISSALQIQRVAVGFWSDMLLALSLVIFAVGIYLIVRKKKEQADIEHEKIDSDNTRISP